MIAQRGSDLFITSIITDRIGRHEVLLPIDHKIHNFREKKKGKICDKIRRQKLKSKRVHARK